MPIFFRISEYSGQLNRMELPLTYGEVLCWRRSGDLVQNRFPQLTPEQREFLISGTTPDEWSQMRREIEEQEEVAHAE